MITMAKVPISMGATWMWVVVMWPVRCGRMGDVPGGGLGLSSYGVDTGSCFGGHRAMARRLEWCCRYHGKTAGHIVLWRPGPPPGHGRPGLRRPVRLKCNGNGLYYLLLCELLF